MGESMVDANDPRSARNRAVGEFYESVATWELSHSIESCYLSKRIFAVDQFIQADYFEMTGRVISPQIFHDILVMTHIQNNTTHDIYKGIMENDYNGVKAIGAFTRKHISLSEEHFDISLSLPKDFLKEIVELI